MAYGSPHVLEHGTSRGGRWLRERRTRLAFWIAVVEALLVVLHTIPKWPAILVAAAVIVSYLGYGRSLRSDTARQAGWIAAASQALVVLVPVLVFIVGTIALVAVALLAVFALIVLFTERA